MPVMTLFRPQRGGLADAMAEVEPCTSREMLEAILHRGSFPMDLVSVEAYPKEGANYDIRIDWDTYIVMGRWTQEFRDLNPSRDMSGVFPAGFTNGSLPIEEAADNQKIITK